MFCFLANFQYICTQKQYMERFIMQDLIAWKNREDRKPLILLGARQVGKTYLSGGAVAVPLSSCCEYP